jgi:hypothetical protein
MPQHCAFFGVLKLRYFLRRKTDETPCEAQAVNVL